MFSSIQNIAATTDMQKTVLMDRSISEMAVLPTIPLNTLHTVGYQRVHNHSCIPSRIKCQHTPICVLTLSYSVCMSGCVPLHSP